MNNYATLSQNLPTKQNPAQSSRKFMKHPDKNGVAETCMIFSQ
jgi:hypothetical protein